MLSKLNVLHRSCSSFWGRTAENEHSKCGPYLAEMHPDIAGSASVVGEPEILTPVKNGDGSGSFKSRWNKYISAMKY
ncbi:hypothetical protein PRIPAC_90470 [Pristionchus pacificus]|uniref:Uncharacterized protein n=1 Tax=Pristionchus pacificus TaxID=54126 RepID=A0A2A6CWQ1_PRIPA|nr:hypothetical protein PRIPAC_90470 [Pristionchus pacificus]|eukprot:PDM82652.1 hypothetical protein PRIPAC_37045 [Pristionchus pacificus]